MFVFQFFFVCFLCVCVCVCVFCFIYHTLDFLGVHLEDVYMYAHF